MTRKQQTRSKTRINSNNSNQASSPEPSASDAPSIAQTPSYEELMAQLAAKTAQLEYANDQLKGKGKKGKGKGKGRVQSAGDDTNDKAKRAGRRKRSPIEPSDDEFDQNIPANDPYSDVSDDNDPDYTPSQRNRGGSWDEEATGDMDGNEIGRVEDDTK